MNQVKALHSRKFEVLARRTCENRCRTENPSSSRCSCMASALAWTQTEAHAGHFNILIQNMRQSQLDPDQNVKATDFCLVPPSVKNWTLPTGSFPVGDFSQPIDGDTQAVTETSFCCSFNDMHIKAYFTSSSAIMPFTLQQQPEW